MPAFFCFSGEATMHRMQVSLPEVEAETGEDKTWWFFIHKDLEMMKVFCSSSSKRHGVLYHGRLTSISCVLLIIRFSTVKWCFFVQCAWIQMWLFLLLAYFIFFRGEIHQYILQRSLARSHVWISKIKTRSSRYLLITFSVILVHTNSSKYFFLFFLNICLLSHM